MIPTKYDLSSTQVITKEDEKRLSNNAENSFDENRLNQFDSGYSTVSLQEIFDKYNLSSAANKTVEEVEGLNQSERDFTTLMQVNQALPEEETTDSVEQHRGIRQDNVFIQNRNVQPGLNFRGKLLVAVYSLVMILLGALMVTNAVSADIKSLSSSITEEEINISDLKRAYDTLNRADNLTERAYHADMSEITSSALINLLPVSSVANSQIDTNWFNELCDYLSRAFGG